MKKNSLFLGFFMACILAFLRSPAQPINLDNPVKAGELTLFPDIGNANNYYYISDKPRLAKSPAGKYQFSFLRYVENTQMGK